MKRLRIILVLVFLAVEGSCQIDSLWNIKYSSRMIPLSGTKINIKGLIGTDGKKVDLDKYKGKVIYLSFWDPGCGAALVDMRYEPLLLSSLETLGIDSQIVFIKVCDHRVSFEEWKNYIDTNNLVGIQLYTKRNIFKMFDRKKLSDPPVGTPNYWIIDKNGIILGTSVSTPEEFFCPIYLLEKALESVKCSESVLSVLKDYPRIDSKTAEMRSLYQKLELKQKEYLLEIEETDKWIEEVNKKMLK
jgi:hypothetical protein